METVNAPEEEEDIIEVLPLLGGTGLEQDGRDPKRCQNGEKEEGRVEENANTALSLSLFGTNVFQNIQHSDATTESEDDHKLPLKKKKIPPSPAVQPNKPSSSWNKEGRNVNRTLYHPINAEITAAVTSHEKEMMGITHQIASLLIPSENELEGEKNKRLETISALENQRIEMNLQLETFQTLKSRAETDDLNKEELQGQLRREIFRLRNKLPALSMRNRVENYLATRPSRFLIVQGQTGSGKSTQLPQYFADHPSLRGKKVVCTQPRKVAAISLQQRVSYEYGGGIKGQESPKVGYQVGGSKEISAGAIIEFVTEGIMLERVMSQDPSHFSNVGCIIVDEAHERSILCDLLLGSFKQEDARWKDIFIVVTSATIDVDEFSKFFNSAPTVSIPGKLFPIEIIYQQPLDEGTDLTTNNIRKRVVQTALDIHVKSASASGDILCFLPGQDDVIKAQDDLEHELQKLPQQQALLLPKVLSLYGKQDLDQQRQVFQDLGHQTRKIIFATDVAETSVTINGIAFVVDSGVKKEMQFDAKRNISSLRLASISKGSAAQRAGRCGRTRAGQCYRLYSQLDYENMNVAAVPEIFRKPLSLAVLSLMEMNLSPKDFEWISSPSKEALLAAGEELRLLGAVTAEGKPTDLGKLIAGCQQEPKLVRMVYRGCKLGFGDSAVLFVSILSVGSMFYFRGMDEETQKQGKKMRDRFAREGGDLVSMFRAFQQYLHVLNGTVENAGEEQEQDGTRGEELLGEAGIIIYPRIKKNRAAASDWCRKHFVNGKAAGIILSTQIELLRQFRVTKIWKERSQMGIPSDQELQKLVLSGYFLHIARKTNMKRARFPHYFAMHSSVNGILDRQSAILYHKSNISVQESSESSAPEWIVFEKILRLSSTTLFPIATPIELDWLFEESSEFSQLCLEKEDTLPTEKVVQQCSQECLRHIFGKLWVNLDSLEDELQCSLETEVDHGIIIAYCSNLQKQGIQQKLKAKVDQAVSYLSSQSVEEDYLGGTRLVVGSGLEVKEVLFPNQYITVMVRGLSNHDRNEMAHHLKQLGLSEWIASINFFQYKNQRDGSTSNMVLKFNSKWNAKEALDMLRSSTFHGIRGLDAVPLMGRGAGGGKGVYQQEVCKLKVSFALGNSQQKAKVCFRTASEANRFIDNVSILFYGATVTMVHGEGGGGKGKSMTKKTLPPVEKVALRQYRFQDTGIETGLEYMVTVAQLPPDIDESEICQRAKPSVVKWIKLFRKERELPPSPQEIEKWRQEILDPFRPHINTSEIAAAYFKHDKNCGRGVLWVSVQDNIRLQKACKLTSHNERPFNQPIRVEVEYNHTTSVHVELYKFVEKEVLEITTFAKKKDCIVNINQPKNPQAKFVHLRFRCCRAQVIRQLQQKLENISTSSKFNHEHIDRLFTSFGKTKLDELRKSTFLHWNARTHALYIYGTPAMQDETKEKLVALLSQLCKIEKFDTPMLLNKRKLDLRSRSDLDKIKQICTSVGLAHYSFLGSNRLLVTGSSEEVQKLEERLEKGEMLFRREPSINTKWIKKPNCSVCGYPPEDPYVRSSVCQHLYCLDCIKPMLSMQQPDHPVTCPGEDCAVLLSIADIHKIAGRSDINKLLEVAVQKYQEQNKEDVLLCPRQECGQLLSAGDKITGEYGGEFYFCDECCTNYCLVCSIKLKKPINSHEFESCQDCQVGLSQDVSFHVKIIREDIFNLKCPRCSTTFCDFDGCGALECGKCRAAFCGLCLQDCGTDAHPHVRNCSKNPQKGTVHVSSEVLPLIHKELRIERLNEYLNKIEQQRIKNGIYRAIRKDLIDLRIDEKEINFGNLLANPDLPEHWEPMRDHLAFMKVEVPRRSQEFENVEQLIRNSLTNEIICLERIQNSSVYLAYEGVKKTMLESGLAVEERQLFHGTMEENIDVICKENFNPNATVRNGSSFGRGTYFARDASYSLGYCVSSAGSVGKKMFVCKVLIGQKTVMDNPVNPSIFVQQGANSFYPEYVVELR